MSWNSGQDNNQGTIEQSTRSTTTHVPTVTTTTISSHASRGPQTTVTASGPRSITITHPTVTTTQSFSFQSGLAPPAPATALQTERRPLVPSIRIRRQSVEQTTQSQYDSWHGSQRRSSSEPQRPPLMLLDPQDDLAIQPQMAATLQTLHEEGSGISVPQLWSVSPTVPQRSPNRPGLGRRPSAIALRHGGSQATSEYGSNVVDMLDVIDPEVSTLMTLNNVQNSLFIPNLGWLYARRPTYELSASPLDTSDEEAALEQRHAQFAQPSDGATESKGGERRPAVNRLPTTNTISSVLTGLSEGHNYAVLPHGAELPGWTREDKAMLNDHVRHLMHSRRAKFRRGMRGFCRYVRKPVGFLITLYAFLLTFWGAAWVLFLIGWISAGDRQAYFIEICDQILTALFCLVGIGMAPWRAIDTYHMIFVAHYAHLTWRLRRQRGLPDLQDRNELPVRPVVSTWEAAEVVVKHESEQSVLTAAQQRKLEHHQDKLTKSHTFYKPRETDTHRAFSIRLLVAIVVLLDCHSLFQMALGGTTWGIYYKDRPKVLTAVILACSISCNISAGITISVGDRRSRKTLVVEQIFRQGVTEEALDTFRKEKGLPVIGVGRKKSRKRLKKKTKG